ncbi:MAG: aminotransferase class IV [Acidimicrobiia bacterium]
MDSPAGQVWCNGALVDAAAATVPFDDHGLVVGDGVFETLATRRGRPYGIRRHLERLRRSAAGLGLSLAVDDATLRDAIEAVTAAHPYGGDGRELRIRVTVTGGRAPLGSARGDGPPTVVIAAGPLAPPAPSARVVVVPWPRNERGALAGLKTTSYAENVLALEHAHRHGGDEAVFANTVGELCEGTGSNVFVVLDGRAVTPPLSSGCLAGVTRALVLEAGLAVEAPLPLAALLHAEEAFLTSTTRLGQPISHVDGRALSPPGPCTRRVQQALEALLDADPDA